MKPFPYFALSVPHSLGHCIKNTYFCRVKKTSTIMGNFFTSLFSSSKAAGTEEDKAKDEAKKFDVLKYDGIRARQIGKTAYAIRCFNEALLIREDFETMNYLAATYSMAAEPEKALEVIDRMVALEPDHVDTWLMRVNLLFMLDREAEVAADCERIISLDASNHLPYYLQAKAKRTGGDLFGAIADLTRAVELKADFAPAYLLRAEILLGMQQGAEALADVEKTIEQVPEEESAYLLRGRIYELLADREKAAADYRRVLELNPFNEEAVLLAGGLLISEEKYDEAVGFFDEAIDTNPSFAKAYAERGRAKNLKGDKAGAFEDLKKAIELNPEGEEARKFDGQHSNFDNLYKGGIF